MFPPSRHEARLFFFNIWGKKLKKEPFTGIEKKASLIIEDHPEYHYILDHPKLYSDFDFSTEHGTINPFLHLSLHLTIVEQIDTDQPRGIVDLFQQLCIKHTNEHDAKHAILDILAEEIWSTIHNKTIFDNVRYLQRIKKVTKN
ncbi:MULTISPECIES: DUF1841 family protein [Candidatus Ichthyocystis]|uniref:DUF1841 family protein n=1 Tax=Candidatus Ichthyocystis TaxID=2929841 RepID=UPI000AFEDD33|nr:MULTISPECIES: DUF1841 family protein [Ichthyocystis]